VRTSHECSIKICVFARMREIATVARAWATFGLGVDGGRDRKGRIYPTLKNMKLWRKKMWESGYTTAPLLNIRCHVGVYNGWVKFEFNDIILLINYIVEITYINDSKSVYQPVYILFYDIFYIAIILVFFFYWFLSLASMTIRCL